MNKIEMKNITSFIMQVPEDQEGKTLSSFKVVHRRGDWQCLFYSLDSYLSPSHQWRNVREKIVQWMHVHQNEKIYPEGNEVKNLFEFLQEDKSSSERHAEHGRPNEVCLMFVQFDIFVRTGLHLLYASL